MYIIRFTNNFTKDHIEFCFADLDETAHRFMDQCLKHQCHVPMPWEHLDGQEGLEFKSGDDCLSMEVIWKQSLK